MKQVLMCAIVAAAMITILVMSIVATSQRPAVEQDTIPICIEYSEQRIGANVQKVCTKQMRASV